jgi:hypothetical protein
MEELIVNLLKNQVIRPNVNPYSSPTIPVKKKRWNVEALY